MATLTPRKYQEAVINDIAQSFQMCHSVMAVMPTGSGKTPTAAIFSLDYPRILWAAHRRELIDQANAALTAVHHKDFECASVFAKPPAGHFDLLVMDETHHMPAPILTRFVNQIDCDKILGLTATPFRLDKKFLDFDDTVFGATYDELVAAGFLVPIELHSLRIRGTRHIAIIEWLLTHPDKAIHSIVFVPNLADAKFFVATLSQFGFKAEAVYGEQSATDRAETLERFTKGKTDIVVSCMVLTEGTDLPIAQTIVLARETSSLALLTQMVGRGVRPYPDKTHCNVIEAIDVMNKAKQSVKAIVQPRKQYLYTQRGSQWTTTPIE